MTNAIMPSYARIDIAFERGEGAYLFAADGRRYLDFASGVAVNVLGHSHPHLVEVLQAQAGKLWHCSNLYRIPEQERLAERLVANSFADKAFFCNSGAEAVEAATPRGVATKEATEEVMAGAVAADLATTTAVVAAAGEAVPATLGRATPAPGEPNRVTAGAAAPKVEADT